MRSSLQIEGIPVHVIDTAGLRDTDDPIEKIGIERTWREIERADVVVLLVDVADRRWPGRARDSCPTASAACAGDGL